MTTDVSLRMVISSRCTDSGLIVTPATRRFDRPCRGAAVVVALLTLLTGHSRASQAPAAPELFVCGWDEVFILKFDDEKPQRTWTWRAKGRADIPDELERMFNTTDECKPFDGGARVLITSSGGAVALVDRAQDRVLFYGRATNAHSADLLPGGRVAVAASHHATAKGDRLIVFDLAKSDQELLSEELPWGHGVVWDEPRKLLWALADKDIRVYELREWQTAAPKLHRVALIPLPEAGGHDFSVVDRSVIAVSTGTRVWLFDRETRTFRPHPELGDKAKVKSITRHPVSGRLAYVQAEGENWWAERIHFLNPAGTLHVPGEHFYKARWK
jgi:hypothetical protein